MFDGMDFEYLFSIIMLLSHFVVRIVDNYIHVSITLHVVNMGTTHVMT